MIDRNRCQFRGQLRDVKTIPTKSGTSFAVASVSVSNGKDKSGEWRPSTYAALKAFDWVADKLAAIPEKAQVLIDCRYDTETYESNNGTKQKKHFFVVNDVVEIAASNTASYTESEQERKPIDDDIPF